ncbi:hypothetical protein FHS25_001538 [Rhizobium laguerreae]|uniref:Uncharacterized protein n=1 Tax=Rhizobium laguerreae TaxID=1076926 RepID=A0ABR6G486_9HYPH|nr:hypothetical protein [Rhizobium laguerreae]MBB3161089.1 hypothetical protein [Rhizobium laguerreae]
MIKFQLNLHSADLSEAEIRAVSKQFVRGLDALTGVEVEVERTEPEPGSKGVGEVLERSWAILKDSNLVSSVVEYLRDFLLREKTLSLIIRLPDNKSVELSSKNLSEENLKRAERMITSILRHQP